MCLVQACLEHAKCSVGSVLSYVFRTPPHPKSFVFCIYPTIKHTSPPQQNKKLQTPLACLSYRPSPGQEMIMIPTVRAGASRLRPVSVLVCPWQFFPKLFPWSAQCQHLCDHGRSQDISCRKATHGCGRFSFTASERFPPPCRHLSGSTCGAARPRPRRRLALEVTRRY